MTIAAADVPVPGETFAQPFDVNLLIQLIVDSQRMQQRLMREFVDFRTVGQTPAWSGWSPGQTGGRCTFVESAGSTTNKMLENNGDNSRVRESSHDLHVLMQEVEARTE